MAIRRVATPKGRESRGCYSIEGTRLFERALRAGADIQRVLIGESLYRNPSDRVADVLVQLGSTPVVVAPDSAVEELCEGRDLGRILGLVGVGAAASIAQLVAADGQARFLVAVDVEEPGNTGALVRTALASGAAACICIGRSDPLHPKAVRTSMGSIFRLPVLRMASIEELLDLCREVGVRTVGAVSSDGHSPWKVDWKAPVALLVGSEAFGLAADVAGQLDERVSIPMPICVDSYSVNAAAAVLLYEAGPRRAAS